MRIHKRVLREVEKFNTMQRITLGDNAREINSKNYIEYILKNSSNMDKRQFRGSATIARATKAPHNQKRTFQSHPSFMGRRLNKSNLLLFGWLLGSNTLWTI